MTFLGVQFFFLLLIRNLIIMRIAFLCCSWPINLQSENDLFPWLHQLETSFKNVNSDASALFCRKQMHAEGRRRVTRPLAEAARCRCSWRFYRCQHSAKTSDSAAKTWTNENWVSYNSLLFQELQTLVAFTSPYNHIIWHPENVCLSAHNSTTLAFWSSKMAKFHWKWPATGTFLLCTLAMFDESV